MDPDAGAFAPSKLTSKEYGNYETQMFLETERGGRGAPKIRPKTDAECGPLLVGDDHSCRAQLVRHSCLEARSSLQLQLVVRS